MWGGVNRKYKCRGKGSAKKGDLGRGKGSPKANDVPFSLSMPTARPPHLHPRRVPLLDGEEHRPELGQPLRLDGGHLHHVLLARHDELVVDDKVGGVAQAVQGAATAKASEGERNESGRYRAGSEWRP